MGWGDSEFEAEIGVGSDIRGRTEGDMAPELAELADCLVGLVAPAPSLADELRLPEVAWSSGWFAVCDF